MSSSQQSQARTRMFARVIGPFLVIVTATAVGRASDMRTLLSQFGANSVWPWVTGAFVLLSGLVVIALHQCWRGTAEVIVSVLGWLTAVKGLFLMTLPHTYLSAANSAVGATGWLGEQLHRHGTDWAVPGLCGLGSGTKPAGTSGRGHNPGSATGRVR